MNTTASRWNRLTRLAILALAAWRAQADVGRGEVAVDAPRPEFSTSAGPDAAAIASTMRVARQRLASLRVRHTNTLRRVGVDRPTTQTTVFMFQHGMAFVETQNDARDAIEARPLDHERAQLFFDGETFYKCWRQDRIVLESPLDKTQPFMLKQVYLDGLALWPYDRGTLAPVSESLFYLPDALEQNAYVVVERGETSTGTPCTVLECRDIGPAHLEERIWLDETKDWALRKRLTRARRTPNRQDSAMLVVLDDYRNMGSGIWMPWRIETSQLRRLRGEDDAFAPIAEDALTVDEMAVNVDIAPSAFKPVYQPGALVRRLDTGAERTLPGGDEVLEMAAANAGEILQWQGREQTRAVERCLKAGRRIAAFALPALAGLVALAVFQRRSSRTPAETAACFRERSRHER